jgi:hypothetical protein
MTCQLRSLAVPPSLEREIPDTKVPLALQIPFAVAMTDLQGSTATVWVLTSAAAAAPYPAHFVTGSTAWGD